MDDALLVEEFKRIFDLDIDAAKRQKRLLQLRTKLQNEGIEDVDSMFKVGLIRAIDSNRPKYRPLYIALLHELFKYRPETLKIYKKYEEDPLFPNINFY